MRYIIANFIIQILQMSLDFNTDCLIQINVIKEVRFDHSKTFCAKKRIFFRFPIKNAVFCGD